MNIQEKIKLPIWRLTRRQLCDLELILNGAFDPLDGFMRKSDYSSVLENMKLKNGIIFPIPITLDVNNDFVKKIPPNNQIFLSDEHGVLLAKMYVEDVWKPNKKEEAQYVFNTLDEIHPGVNYLINHTNQYYVSGRVSTISFPIYYDFVRLRHTPNQLKIFFKDNGFENIIAFQTRNPMHRAHIELTLRSISEYKAFLLIHPVVGVTKNDDIDYQTRVRCYEKILHHYPRNSVKLSLLPLAMRMAGPREALWHAIIRKNYGATHFIVGRDHAGPGKNSQGSNFYPPYAAQELAKKYEDEIQIKIIPCQEMVYIKADKKYMPIDRIKNYKEISSLSGTELREYLRKGISIPKWYTYPEVIEELQKRYLKPKVGITIFFTGLPGSGKSTLARALKAVLLQEKFLNITLLDGDEIRLLISSELGFSKKDRETNILRVGYIAREITKHQGITICALIAPYEESREKIKSWISKYGKFIEIYVSTPLEECIKRDTKGLYAKALSGTLSSMTGISDVYEPPKNPNITVDTTNLSILESVKTIVSKLVEWECTLRI